MARERLVVAAVLVAAGEGSRLGAGVPKAFVEVAGRSLLVHAAARMRAASQVRDLVVVAPAALVETATGLVPDAIVVAGGRTRQQSVARGLAALAADVEAVLVHDVARAFTPLEVIARVVDALAEGAGAVVPAIPVVDTVKRVTAEGLVATTLERAELRAVQTPQGFTCEVARAAHASESADAPDDAALAEHLGIPVRVVAGHDDAFKITGPRDLLLAELLCRDRNA